MVGHSLLQTAVWRASVVCVALQALLSLGVLWARRPAYSWTGLFLPLVTAAGALGAGTAVWRRDAVAIVRLAVSHGAMLKSAGLLALALRRSPWGRASDILLEPGSRLPPNEIFRSESVLDSITVPLLLAGLLAVPGLVATAVLWLADRRAQRS